MASVKEQSIINQLASQCESIDGIRTSYGFAQNPDVLTRAALPAIVFVPISFESQAKGHHNVHQNVLNISGILFVSERQAQGGTLRYLENDALPFMYKFRSHFQQDAVIRSLLGLGLTQATIVAGNYGAGGPLLTWGEVPYIGVVFRWTFVEVN